MRKKLHWAVAENITLSSDDKPIPITKLEMSVDNLDRVIDMIYRLRHDYILEMGSDPKGIILPCRIYCMLQMHGPDVFKMIPHKEVKAKECLFGLDVYPSAGSEIALIPDYNDVFNIMYREEI